MFFLGKLQKEKMENWLSSHTSGENLYVTNGTLNGSINMVITSNEMADVCRDLMYEYRHEIIKFAVTFSGWAPFINVELEFKNKENEISLIKAWDKNFNSKLEFVHKRKVV
jgi:hypothetical protein